MAFIGLECADKGDKSKTVLVSMQHIMCIESDRLSDGTLVTLVDGTVLVCVASYSDVFLMISRALGDG